MLNGESDGANPTACHHGTAGGEKVCPGLIALALLALAPATASTGEAALPGALVRDLYARHAKGNGPFAEPEDRALVERFFDEPLAEAIRKDAIDAKGEVGAMDADPLYDAQDTDIKKLTFGTPSITPETAKVVVAFENFGEKRTVTYLLVKKGVGWRISDVQYADGRSLFAIYRSATR
jgi:uncharacterized protein DUF3828